VSGNSTDWLYKNRVAALHLYRVAYGKGTFVAVGDSGTIIQSDPVLTLKASSLAGDTFTFISAGEVGPTHTWQTSTNLLNWEDGGNYQQDQPTKPISDTVSSNPLKFYRIKPETP
jgi:hypothetical protein